MADAAFAFPDDHGRSAPAASESRPLAERVARIRPPSFWPAMAGKRPLSEIERAGLIRLADSIPGVCSDEKMVALMEAMRHAPVGDVIDIGSGCGRTAAVLVWLARRYAVGQVLCLDRWTDESVADFEIDLAPLAEGRLNHLPIGGAAYEAGLTVCTKTFGETCYEGRAAMLHIALPDADLPAWTRSVAPGGWIVFDGCGEAASAFADANAARICARFAAGGAEFVQLKR
jgi:SAM-dependent methyltransferase